jgi:lysozyme
VLVLVSQQQFDALCSLAYNVGCGSVTKSTLLKKLNAGDIPGAAAEFVKWDHAGGKELAGLKARREAEAAQFLS